MSWEDEAVVEDIAAAGRLLSDTISRDLRCFASGDLLDAVDAARYSTHPYTTPLKEWPPYVDVARKKELPPQVVECYNAGGGQGMACCGIFPTIRRAWATVDETLFMWRFDKWDGTCLEYSGEEQAICAVGLSKVRPGVFVEAIQYLLVLATPVELVLLGVCCGASSDGTDPFSELSLQPLPEYTIPTDGVTMTCVSSTEKGRIFLGGRDGHIYELLYTTGLGWQSRCRKICHTGGLGSLLSRWVIPAGLKFGAADSVSEIAVDDERNTFYVRTQESKVQIFDLGKTGDAAPRKIAEEKNFGDSKDARHRAVASRGGSRAVKANLISLAPVSNVESKYLHLVAITSDGRRVYMSTTPTIGGSQVAGGSSVAERPSMLRVAATRPGPSVGVGGGITLSAVPIASRPQGESLKLQAAQYSSGNVLLADSSTSSRLIVARKDYTSPVIAAGSPSYGGTSGRNMRALREVVTSVGVEGQTFAVTDVLPPPDQAAIAEALVWDSSVLGSGGLGEVSRARALWSLGDLATQHILPRRRAVVVSTHGLMEIVMNRPVDLLQRLFETNTSRTVLEDFFQRFGAGEAAAMCLLLAARIIAFDEKLISTGVAERAAEAFEDPRLVGLPQMQGGGATTSAANTSGGFNMGQVVQEAEPVFSGAHEGLCLCASRLLWSVWELPVFTAKGDAGGDFGTDVAGILSSRIAPEAMSTLEDKIRNLEMFLRTRRNQRRGHYGRIMGIGDTSGYGERRMAMDGFGREAAHKMQYDTPFARQAGGLLQGGASKRQRLAFSPAELAAMEVRGMECVRRLLRRSAEALLLLQLLSQHHLTRLAQSLDTNTRHQLVQLTFHQLVCSQEGEYIATRLIAALMEYYVSPDGRGTVDDISMKLREGCPSYYNEADDKFYQAVQFLEKAASARDVELREHLAKQALDLLAKVPETANLLSVCQRFEEIRFYEAVVELALRKSKALDPNDDAFNEHVDENRRKMALVARQQCYEVVTNALRSLASQPVQNGHAHHKGPVDRSMDAASRARYIRQIVQLSVRSPDRAFHEYLYDTMIELGLEKELLELAGPDLVPFLQAAGDFQTTKPAKGPRVQPSVIHLMKPITTHQAKYLELLSRYYVHKRQHALAAYVLLRLAERKPVEGSEQLSLETRHEYLSNAVVQARSIRHGIGALGSSSEVGESGLLELLEGKLAVLRFQLRIQSDLDAISSKMDMDGGGFPSQNFIDSETFVNAAREKSVELGAELKSITQLYNNYAVPFELWEVCLEILHFSHYTSDAENNVMRETWARLIDQCIKISGIAEACAVVRRVGPQLYPGDGGSMPLDSICVHLERAAEERVTSGAEIVGDEDVPRSLMAACHDSQEPVQRTYDHLLNSTAVLPSTSLRLRMLRSVLSVLREWTMLVVAQRIGSFSDDSIGVRDKLCSTVNRYMTEVKRLPLSPAQVEPVARGFKELEEMLLGSQSLQLH